VGETTSGLGGATVATILKLTDGIAVENDAIRLTFPLEDGLVGRYAVHGRTGEEFRRAAVVEPVAEVVYQTQDGATHT